MSTTTAKLAAYAQGHKLVTGCIVTGVVALVAIGGVLAWSNSGSSADTSIKKPAISTKTDNSKNNAKDDAQATAGSNQSAANSTDNGQTSLTAAVSGGSASLQNAGGASNPVQLTAVTSQPASTTTTGNNQPGKGAGDVTGSTGSTGATGDTSGSISGNTSTGGSTGGTTGGSTGNTGSSTGGSSTGSTGGSTGSTGSQTGTNLIANGDLETANGTVPAGFSADTYGINTPAFTYPVAGHSGNGAQVSYASYTPDASNGGDAKYTTPVISVTAGKTYQFTDYYKSDATTQVDYFDANGNWLGTIGQAPASSDWVQFKGAVTIPAGTTAIMVGHILSSQGTLTTDDYGFAEYTPAAFKQAMVSVTFDDGWANQYANAYSYMQSLHMVGTYYIISGELTNPDEAGYMTGDQVKQLYQSGNEIGSHTVHHCDLTGQQTDNPANCPLNISAAQVQTELQQSQIDLNALLGGNVVTDFAYPYGAYNASTIATAQQYYASQRTVTAGFNTKDSLDPTRLKMYEVDNNITVAQVQSWIDQAKAEGAWLILTYHEVATTPTDSSDTTYTTQPADFKAEMDYLNASGVQVLPVNQALAAAKAQ